METTQRIERLPVDRILIDAYQRTLNNRRVERIAHHFNYAKLGVPVVSRREDGSFAAIDGQHRLSAILDASKGWGVAQRRRRVFAVLDLDGQRAGKVLFESEGLSG